MQAENSQEIRVYYAGYLQQYDMFIERSSTIDEEFSSRKMSTASHRPMTVPLPISGGNEFFLDLK
jgi:hypothetical protein